MAGLVGVPRCGGNRASEVELRIDGEMSLSLVKAFPELDHVVVGGQSVLFGSVDEPSELYRLLLRCESLGLHVIEMRQLSE
ncbi:hypothetical protein ACIP2X_08145 [Streptomyces sp. NPDC089424]|uniref:hypothetical protein n=1 Tax=Streptomyces sp. NPDC089424 TaxID=3365917 RepID=UPI0037FA3623